jgi:hypothetical protein
MNDDDNIYDKDNTKWWDGYDDQETILFDDFRPSYMKFYNLLKIMIKDSLLLKAKEEYIGSRVK